jgi:hypothetical protein
MLSSTGWAISQGRGRTRAGQVTTGLRKSAPLRGRKMLLSHLQCRSIKGGHHRLHVAVLGDVSVGTFVGFG